MTTVLIAGANRGIGLEFVRQYTQDGARVLAGCRSPETADDLRALADGAGGRVDIFALDVGDDASVAAARDALKGEAVDILIVNAGVALQRQATLTDTDYGAFAETLAINTIAPHRVVAAFTDNVRRGGEKKVVIVSSQLGSLTNTTGSGGFTYRVSKAGANMVARTLSFELADDGITVVPVHPGWVRTDMGGSSATLSVEQSVGGLRQVIADLTPAKTGHFFNWDGSELPW